MFPYPAIGVVFNIDNLKTPLYGHDAWRLFMMHLSVDELSPCILLEGDTELTLHSEANEFCIGTYGSLQQINYIRTTFEKLDDPGLAPFHRRLMEKVALDTEPLPVKGEIDAFGRLITDYWTRADHDLCKEANWGYAPKERPADMDASLLAELKLLERPRSEVSMQSLLEKKTGVAHFFSLGPRSVKRTLTSTQKEEPKEILQAKLVIQPEATVIPSGIPSEYIIDKSNIDVQGVLKKAQSIALQKGPAQALEYLRDSAPLQSEPVMRRIYALAWTHRQTLPKKLLEESFLDPIWCQCSVCENTWLISPLLSIDQGPKYRNAKTGLQCSSCNRVLCPQCAAVADSTCPCSGLLWSITRPNGRKRQVQKMAVVPEDDQWYVPSNTYPKDLAHFFGVEGRVPIGIDLSFPTTLVATPEEHLSWAEILIEAGVYYQAKEQLDILEKAAISSPYLQWLYARLELVQLHNVREREKMNLFDDGRDIIYPPKWMKMLDKIKQRLDDVTKQMPTFGAPWLTVAQIYLNPDYSQDFTQALNYAEHAQALMGDTPDVLRTLGMALQAQGRATEAVAVIEQIPHDAEETSLASPEMYLVKLEARYQSQPLDVEAALQLGNWYLRHKELEKARNIFTSLRDHYPDRAETSYGFACLAMRNTSNTWDGRMAEAYHLCQEALTRDPNFGLAYELLGTIFYNLGFGSKNGSIHIENPLDYYKHALALDHTCDVALCALAQDAIESGDIQLALTYLEKAVAVNTDIDEVYNILAVMYKGMRQFEKSVWALQKAQTFFPRTVLTAEYEDLILKLCRFEY